METENITIAAANAHRGELIRDTQGLVPFQNVDVLLLSEVVPKRDNLKNKLEKGGFNLAYTDNLDLAIAVKEGFKVLSAKEYPITSNGFLKRFSARTRIGRLFGARNMIVAKVETPTGEQLDVVTLHPVPPVRPFARRRQVKAMGHILENFVGSDRLVIGADFNHHPEPRKVDIQVREKNRLLPVNLGGKETFIYRRGGQLDDMLYRGKGIEAMQTQVVDVKSDHRAIITSFALNKMNRPVHPPEKEYALAA